MSKELIDRLSVPFPDRAIEQRPGGGGKLLDYVATETVIRRLNDAVMVWDFRITDKLVTDGLLVVWGELTIPGLGTRAGTGVQRLQGGEDMWKGAASDCLKKCATLFNVGIDLYGPDLEAGELPNDRKLPARGRTVSENTVPEPATVIPQIGDWTDFWNAVVALGLPRGKDELKKAIGKDVLTYDPQYSFEQVQALHKDNANEKALA